MLALNVSRIASIIVNYGLVNDAISLLYSFQGGLNLSNIAIVKIFNYFAIKNDYLSQNFLN